jgi:hypothetical protein
MSSNKPFQVCEIENMRIGFYADWTFINGGKATSNILLPGIKASLTFSVIIE